MVRCFLFAPNLQMPLHADHTALLPERQQLLTCSVVSRNAPSELLMKQALGPCRAGLIADNKGWSLIRAAAESPLIISFPAPWGHRALAPAAVEHKTVGSAPAAVRARGRARPPPQGTAQPAPSPATLLSKRYDQASPVRPWLCYIGVR